MNSSLIILAGGKSSRMGIPKGLLKYKTQFWILSQIEKFIGNDVYIGLGFDKEHYFKAIPWLEKAVTSTIIYKEKNIKVVINQNPEFGLFSNIQSVLNQLKKEQSVFILPVDVPLLNQKEQQKIETKENWIVIPKYQEKKGHPIRLKYAFWKSLLSIKLTDSEARLDYQIKKSTSSKPSIINVSDKLCILNLNSPTDWQKFINR